MAGKSARSWPVRRWPLLLKASRISSRQQGQSWLSYLPAFLAAQIALIFSPILALAAALILRLPEVCAAPRRFVLLTLAHLARCAARIRANPAALIFLLVDAPDTAAAVTSPSSLPNCCCSVAILSWISAAWRNCCGVRLIN